jgi:hypothetical protein
LSLFGLIMAFGTISLIPERFEFIFWIAIMLFCAFVIAKRCVAKYFLQGFWVSLVNSIWITIAHVLFYSTYIAHHADMANLGAQIHFLPSHPRLLMLILCPVYGAIFGLLQGLFAFIFSRFIKNGTVKAEV